MKQVKKYITLLVVFVFLCGIVLYGCEKSSSSGLSPEELAVLDDGMEDEDDSLIVVGFSQLGAESDWRRENTVSMETSLTEKNGFRLHLENGQQKQANQIMAIRTFIQQDVDYIVLAPVTEEGWDIVLEEAKEVDIPVILVDRMVNVEDESLFTCWVGADFELEGKKAAGWLHDFLDAKGIPQSEAKIVNIQGNLGASAQIGRTKGLKDAVELYGWNLLAEEPADFTQSKGKEVMKSLLSRFPELNVVYCENDNEAYGAIEAIEEAGRKVGSDITNGDIMIISFDGVNSETMECVLKDKISCVVECNPHHGPLVKKIIEMLGKGIIPEKYSYLEGAIYTHDRTVKEVSLDGKAYPVTVVGTDR